MLKHFATLKLHHFNGTCWTLHCGSYNTYIAVGMTFFCLFTVDPFNFTRPTKVATVKNKRLPNTIYKQFAWPRRRRRNENRGEKNDCNWLHNTYIISMPMPIKVTQLNTRIVCCRCCCCFLLFRWAVSLYIVYSILSFQTKQKVSFL